MVKCFVGNCHKRGYNKDITGVMLCDSCYIKKNISIKVECKNNNLSNISKEELYKISTQKIELHFKDYI